MSGDHNRYQKPDYVDRRQWKYDPMTGEPLVDGWPLYSGLPRPEPEPVAWVAYENGEKHGIDFDEDEIAELPVGTMLYTAPPQREWQGLTEYEVGFLTVFDGLYDVEVPLLANFIRAIEAALKAKNS